MTQDVYKFGDKKIESKQDEQTISSSNQGTEVSIEAVALENNDQILIENIVEKDVNNVPNDSIELEGNNESLVESISQKNRNEVLEELVVLKDINEDLMQPVVHEKLVENNKIVFDALILNQKANVGATDSVCCNDSLINTAESPKTVNDIESLELQFLINNAEEVEQSTNNEIEITKNIDSASKLIDAASTENIQLCEKSDIFSSGK